MWLCSPATTSFTPQVHSSCTVDMATVNTEVRSATTQTVFHRHPSLTFSLAHLQIDDFLYFLPSYTGLSVPPSLIISFSITALLCDQSPSSQLPSTINEDQPLFPTYFIPASLFAYLLQNKFWLSSSSVPLHDASLQPFQLGSIPGRTSTSQLSSQLQACSLSPSTTATFHASLFLQHSWYPHWQVNLFSAFESALGICASGTFWAKGLSVCLACPNEFSAWRFI